MKQLIVLFVMLSLFVRCISHQEQSKNISTSKGNESEKVDYSANVNNDLFAEAKLRLSVLEDILKANKNSITVSGANAKTIIDIKEVTDQFDNALSLINKNDKDKPDSIRTLLAKLEATLKKTQQKEFPLLRKAYIKITDEKLWENNINVSGSGSTITFIGGIFANNKNIKDIQEGVSDQLHLLRFKKSIYRWYDGADGTQYTMESKKDSEL